ncbi:MAG TPA: bifunctional aspartate kinase/diaminopimelate decarboxylase [Thermoanaerobaculia bacterium]|nr:bifunctional aspartate kinase/diaminopimelate decarboxylase [Thermoanaerobaculia bacterium]
MSSETFRWVVVGVGTADLADPERLRSLAGLIRSRSREGLRPLVVLPAIPGMAEHLWEVFGGGRSKFRTAAGGVNLHAMSHSVADPHRRLAILLGLPVPEAESLIAPDLTDLAKTSVTAVLGRHPGARAQVMSFAERLLTRIAAAFFNSEGIPAAWQDACALVRAPKGGGSRPRIWEPLPAEGLARRLEALPRVVVTQAGIAGGPDGKPVRIEPGGSEISASYLAAWLRAERCEIWGDTPGLFTGDLALLPSARLLRAAGYDEAQEILATGGPGPHPRVIPPLRHHRIPLHFGWLRHPAGPGTVVSSAGPVTGPQVKAVAVRTGITLISMETLGMWQEVGFLAGVFARFSEHGLSIDSVSTSETNVTVSLDPTANALNEKVLGALLRDLEKLCEPRVIAPTAALSLVGRGIRGILHELSPVLEVFEEMKVHLVTQAANDLNLTFVVDEDQSDRLVKQLHSLLFGNQTENAVFGPTWAGMFEDEEIEAAAEPEGDWWRARRDELLALAAERGPVYVYDEETLDRAADSVRSLGVFDRVFYSVKANAHAGVLARLEAAGLGFECVSAPELEHVASVFPGIEPARLLFTPNFAPAAEYHRAYELGAWVTIDSLHPLRAWPDVFRGREILVRVDPGRGRGHHAHVRTAGAQSKFGVDPENLGELRELAAGLGARVVGLHAHSGSGIRNSRSWREVALFLAEEAERFPDVRVIDVGGGLGVPEQPGQGPLDLEELGESLRLFRAANPRFELWIEPGRFLVAQAGVLLARVVQVKRKGGMTYVGVETGMNSLIRPALYGAYHPIVNLSRLGEPATMLAHVVGPICETGDILGRSRRLAPAQEGDVLLIANGGAYGRVMSSRYNLREPAGEAMLPSA